MPRAFVIRPFGPKKDSSGRIIDFNRDHAELIGPALEATGLGGETTGGIRRNSGVVDDIMPKASAEKMMKKAQANCHTHPQCCKRSI